ncbi:MAG: ABC transporter substrate-binding protein [Ruminococcus sp.]|nr:ABC transporter substrate-binding protein [Ruminococcus sp.]
MKKLKAFIAAILSAAMSMSLIACGDEASDSTSYDKDLDSSTRDEINSIAAESDLLTGELENKTIKWMSDWDINPDGTGKNVPTDLAVFQERYGGVVEYYQVTYENRYEKLAEAINSGEGIDFFYSGNLDAFPKGAVRGMFQPIDDYIDFSSPLWEGVQEVNDSALWNGSHYMAIVQATGDLCAVIYNRNTIQEAGFEDPAELYEKGEWDWDAFQEMLENFVDTDNQKYGIDGWWFEFGLIDTTGVPAIGLEDGQLVNNLSDPSMERVQNWLYELYNTNCVAIGVGDYGWTAKPQYIGEGKTLFYPCGLYTLYRSIDQWQGDFGEDAFFVPMPKDPDADEYYIPVGMESYVMVTGAQNPEGVAKYLDCKRFVLITEEAKEIADQQMIDDYGWTQEMVDMKNEMQELADANPIFDYSKGVSTDCGDLLDSNLRNAARGVPWNETYDSIYATVETYINEINENPVAN